MIISHRFPLFSAVEHLMKAWKESAIPMKRLFLFFITELRLLPDFFISRPSPIPVILTLKPLVYNDILIFLRQQNSPALCKYIDEYFNDIITKKIHIRQTWSVAAAFLTVLDGFITECSQRETLFPLLENA